MQGFSLTRRRVLLFLVTASLFAVTSGGSALAGSTVYCDGVTISSGTECWGPKHSLRANIGQDFNGAGNTIGVLAYTESFAQYGLTVYGVNYSCHSYSGANVLYPAIYNPMAGSVRIHGLELWGSEPACP